MHPRQQLATVKQTPRGSVVVLGPHLITDELPDEDAVAFASDFNNNTFVRGLHERYDVV